LKLKIFKETFQCEGRCILVSFYWAIIIVDIEIFLI